MPSIMSSVGPFFASLSQQGEQGQGVQGYAGASGASVETAEAAPKIMQIISRQTVQMHCKKPLRQICATFQAHIYHALIHKVQAI